MNAVTTILAAALLAAGSTAVLAQADATADPDTNPPGVEEEGEDDPHEDAAGVPEVDYDAIATSIGTASVTAADIEGLTTEADIQVVRLSELRVQAAENAAAIDEGLTSAEAGIADLRTAIGANTEASSSLGAVGFSPDDVVAVTTAADGALVLVVDDESQ